MALILTSGRALTLLGGVGYDLLSGTIIRSCRSIGNTVYYLTQSSDDSHHIAQTLYQLDLEAKIAIINSYIKQMSDSNQLRLNTDQFCEDHRVEKIEHFDFLTAAHLRELAKTEDAQRVAFLYLHQSLQRIDGILTGLKRKIPEHKQKWFHQWRSMNLKESLRQLEAENDILDQRLKLIKSLSLIRSN